MIKVTLNSLPWNIRNIESYEFDLSVTFPKFAEERVQEISFSNVWSFERLEFCNFRALEH